MANTKKPDLFKIKLTLGAARKYYELLTAALDRNDQRGVGRELHNLGRELGTLARLLDQEPPQDWPVIDPDV